MSRITNEGQPLEPPKLSKPDHVATIPPGKKAAAAPTQLLDVEPGVRVTVDAAITGLHPAGTTHGVGLMWIAVSDNNETIVFHSQAAWTELADIGSRIRVAGTVKSHKPYRGTPQTQLARVSVVLEGDHSQS